MGGVCEDDYDESYQTIGSFDVDKPGNPCPDAGPCGPENCVPGTDSQCLVFTVYGDSSTCTTVEDITEHSTVGDYHAYAIGDNTCRMDGSGRTYYKLTIDRATESGVGLIGCEDDACSVGCTEVAMDRKVCAQPDWANGLTVVADGIPEEFPEEETDTSDDETDTSDDKEETDASDDKEETDTSDDKEETDASDDKEETDTSDDKEEADTSDDKEEADASATVEVAVRVSGVTVEEFKEEEDAFVDILADGIGVDSSLIKIIDVYIDEGRRHLLAAGDLVILFEVAAEDDDSAEELLNDIQVFVALPTMETFMKENVSSEAEVGDVETSLNLSDVNEDDSDSGAMGSSHLLKIWSVYGACVALYSMILG